MTHSDYYALTNELFEKWISKAPFLSINHNNNFIKDGVVCPEQWFSQKTRPLFLLKEAYTTDGNMDDLIADHLRSNAPMHKMWERISYWTKGILEISQKGIIPPYQQDTSIKFYDNPYLEKTAVINVKKSSGNNYSNNNNIQQYAEYDSSEIIQQLKICSPNIIICGNTGSFLKTIAQKQNCRFFQNNKFEKDNYIYHIILNDYDIPVINFWHPANHFPDILNYYGILNIYKSLITEGDL